ncbi:hypothetical protein EYF80_056519 [Liparis tanakae]|uniref:Uncharacterized protein n=1 Tax=Liparis tanakae TaxID=230148 RepID=A0A4Z2EWZ2_9TELE|nr:hypothetical protein EYF80_056519 [Liparis tanakae]
MGSPIGPSRKLEPRRGLAKVMVVFRLESIHTGATARQLDTATTLEGLPLNDEGYEVSLSGECSADC